MQPVLLPILDANMTHGIIRAWFKQEGDAVHAGEPLFEVETDKVNAEVEAETGGILRQIVAPVGARVPVLGILAFVGGAGEALPAPETWSALPVLPGEAADEARARALRRGSGQASTSSARTVADPFQRDSSSAHPEPVEGSASGVATASRGQGTRPRRLTASPAARRLARERGIALEQIRGTGARGEITRADVEATTTAAPGGAASGDIDPAFLTLLRRDPAAFRMLSSDLKVHLYRQHGAHIGDGVRIDPGAIIIANHISIGAASTIGADSSIECERLQLGRLVAFGRRTRVRCRCVAIGDALWSKDDVVIGGGGSDEPGARLRAGDACFFGEGAYLNTGYPLTLGDEVCIGSRAMLFTHSHWQSVLRGYPSLFAPIQVDDHVFIGNNAFVFPGVTIGAGATVMVNSFVALNVPADTLVGGVPAQVMRHVVAPPRAEQIAIVRERLMPELASVLSARGLRVARRDVGNTMALELGSGATVAFFPAWEPNAVTERSRTVALAFADASAPTLPPGATLFDLAGGRVHGVQDDLSDEVREVCRRRGIRFRPLAWRYRVGHCEGEHFVPRSHAK